MPGVSTYLGNLWLNSARGVAFTPPQKLYLALFNGDPETTGTEVTTTIRTTGRPEIPFTASTAKSIQNSADVDFGASAGSATITHFGVYDAPTGGNLWFPKQISAQRQVAQGDPVKYPSGNLKFNI